MKGKAMKSKKDMMHKMPNGMMMSDKEMNKMMQNKTNSKKPKATNKGGKK